VEAFEAIGRELRERWARSDFDENLFPALATEALERARPHEWCGQRELLGWLARSQVLPRQDAATFGQPPINLYRDDMLYIEALFWIDGTTEIHQHAFSGAFCVLDGSSVHAVYAFERTERISDQLQLGVLHAADVELLRPGQVRPITAGNSFIHALFHLERPTLSLVARTHQARSHAIQYSYYPPGLALDAFWRPQSLDRRLAVLGMLLDSGHPELRPFAATLVDGADATALVLALQQINVHERGFGLVGPLLERASSRHQRLVPMLRNVLDQDRARTLIMVRRRAIVTPELRFFLALLLNIPDRQRILELVRQRFPERDPVHTVVEWLREMQALPAEGGNSLGTELDEDGFWIVQRLLEGRSEAELTSEAARTGRALRAAQIAQQCFVLPFNSVLGRLLK
jgi:hypothetical protein